MTTNAQSLDQADPLAHYRARFSLPEKTIYLDGNSLGALPKGVSDVVRNTLEEEWGQELIRSWNSRDWIRLPLLVGDKIAPLLGAGQGQVICTDSTSINLFKLIAAGLGANPGRTKILSTSDNFPTDLYMAQGLSELLGRQRVSIVQVPEENILSSIDEQTALLMLTHVNFRDGRMLDISTLSRAAAAKGALTLWDLSHSTGVIPLELDEVGVDFAAGCGYKYLNGGPGAPAYVYVNRKHHATIQQPLTGWMGHDNPFAFSPDYSPAPGITRFLSGTPAILSMRALSAALDIYRDVDLHQVRAKSMALTDFFIDKVSESSSFTVVSPRDASKRGSQVSIQHPSAYAIVQAIMRRGVIGDFRDPDIIRFGFAPLYTRFSDAEETAKLLIDIVETREYEAPEYQVQQVVT